jgi:hypothetical protein
MVAAPLIAWLSRRFSTHRKTTPKSQPVSATADEQEWFRIRTILFDDWDPIPVNHNRNLIDEYDAYIPRMLKALREGKNEDGLTDLLSEITTGSIGIRADLDGCRRVARKLLDHPLSSP